MVKKNKAKTLKKRFEELERRHRRLQQLCKTLIRTNYELASQREEDKKGPVYISAISSVYWVYAKKSRYLPKGSRLQKMACLRKNFNNRRGVNWSQELKKNKDDDNIFKRVYFEVWMSQGENPVAYNGYELIELGYGEMVSEAICLAHKDGGHPLSARCIELINSSVR